MYIPANPYFSEFSYAYAVTEDLIRTKYSGLTIAPFFTSQVEEGRRAGFDLMLERPGIPLFIQFKLAYFMKGNSSEAKAGDFKPPFYRMHLRCSGETNQHALLLALERTGQEVLYTAPAFHLRSDLNIAYASRQVWDRSFQISPAEIGPLDDQAHHISFQKPGPWKCYSPKSDRGGETSDSKAILRHLSNQVLRKRSSSFRDQLRHLDTSISKVFEEQKEAMPLWKQDTIWDLSPQMEPLERVPFLARTLFDCQFFFVTES
jgi:hypothetical protein